MIWLQTKRLIIRDHLHEDLATHHALFNDKKTMYYLQDIAAATLKESKHNLQHAIDEIKNLEHKYYFLRIEDRMTGNTLGK